MKRLIKIPKIVDNNKCPKCGNKGHPRSGANFAGQMICHKCWHTWPQIVKNIYGDLP